MAASVFSHLIGKLGLSLLILGKIIAKNANLGSKKAGLSSDYWENCMILKKKFNWKEAFYRSQLYKL
jgi:hypothetical protein